MIDIPFFVFLCVTLRCSIFYIVKNSYKPIEYIAISAGNDFYEPYAAATIGLNAAIVYRAYSVLLVRFGIDDPLDVVSGILWTMYWLKTNKQDKPCYLVFLLINIHFVFKFTLAEAAGVWLPWHFFTGAKDCFIHGIVNLH